MHWRGGGNSPSRFGPEKLRDRRGGMENPVKKWYLRLDFYKGLKYNM